MSFGKAIAIIGGVAVGAVGAYNYSTTGCPLGTGSCDSGETAVVATVADEGDACPLGCSMESDAATLAVSATAASTDSCCSAEAEACAETVAADAEGMSCCSMDKAAAVMAVAAESSEASCCSAEAAQVTEVAEKAEGCCGQCGDDNAECDPDDCTAGEACCKALATIDD